MEKYALRAFGVVEYFIAGLFIYGGINTFFATPVNSPSLFYHLLAGQAAIYVYAVLFFGLGLALLLSKICNNKQGHRLSLFWMSITCVYVLVLSISLHGITLGLIPSVLIAIITSILWIRWKFKTEYIDPSCFMRDIQHLESIELKQRTKEP